MPTPVHLTHRSPKALLFLLLAVFAAAALAPSSAEAGGVSRTPSLLSLHPGVQGPAVKKLQRMLARLGYPIKPDGQFGPHTATMVRTLRADAGLDRSARVTKRFLNTLKRAQRGGPGDRRWLGIRRLRVGAQGKDVRALQNTLTKLGYPAVTDGQFGPATRTSVRLFERAAGLRVDGVLTPARRAHPQAGRPQGRRRRAPSRCARRRRPRRRRPPARALRRTSPRARPHRLRRPPGRSAATGSRSRRPAHPRPSPRSSRPATPSPTTPTASAAGTRAGRTRATTAPAP